MKVVDMSKDRDEDAVYINKLTILPGTVVRM
jgi:hypothetical protein